MDGVFAASAFSRATNPRLQKEHARRRKAGSELSLDAILTALLTLITTNKLAACHGQ
jgi:hypothetical protein